MSTQGNITPNEARQLLEQAWNEGIIDDTSLTALNTAGLNMGVKIAAGAGKSAKLTKATSTFYLGTLPDDSGSIRGIRDPQNHQDVIGPQMVCDGHNSAIDYLLGSSGVNRAGTYFGTFLLNNDRDVYHDPNDPTDSPDRPVNDFLALESSSLQRLVPEKNYFADFGTPLRDRIGEIMGIILAQVMLTRNRNIDCYGGLLVITDGFDEHSRHLSVAQVRAILDDMRENVIPMFMGVSSNPKVKREFETVAIELGFDAKFIWTPDADPKEFREAIARASSTAALASQGGAAFHSAAAGGGFTG